MKIAIISDSHDNLENLKKALNLANISEARVLIHCGDFCAPFIMDELSKFRGDIHCVFGNIDDRFVTAKKAIENNINLHGDIAKIEVDNHKILITHLPEVAKAFAFSGEFDIVFYGHTHIKNKEKINNTLLVNPGEIMGRRGNPGFAIYDSLNKEVEFIEL